VEPFVVRTGWDQARNPNATFYIQTYGWNEPMPPGLVDCHRALTDWLLVHFHDPVEIKGKRNGQQFSDARLILWGPGDGPLYGHRTESWRHSWMHLGGRVPAMLKRCGLKPGQPWKAPESIVTEEAFRAIHHERAFEPHPHPVILENLVTNWLLRLQRVAHGTADLPHGLREVKHRLETRPEEWLDLAAMAELAGLSVSHFCAEFPRQFGEAPGRFQQRRRMEEARYILRIRKWRVSEVAEALGYADAFAFSKAFRKENGQSPRAYRETVR